MPGKTLDNNLAEKKNKDFCVWAIKWIYMDGYATNS